ncbi:DgyrCDS7775 [Dimorphilus gyrociliatus]|uniref:DgyrCDS7775 n=1 Tax=Dimorphilus gyrociliatus TaxID=2664684 RepID=A0A7I8VUB4_9ANNE|nr:DgyrCDS7775 [Dimorphilus gyrociliatus]
MFPFVNIVTMDFERSDIPKLSDSIEDESESSNETSRLEVLLREKENDKRREINWEKRLSNLNLEREIDKLLISEQYKNDRELHSINSKIVVVGDEKSGKTSLIKSLSSLEKGFTMKKVDGCNQEELSVMKVEEIATGNVYWLSFSESSCGSINGEKDIEKYLRKSHAIILTYLNDNEKQLKSIKQYWIKLIQGFETKKPFIIISLYDIDKPFKRQLIKFENNKILYMKCDLDDKAQMGAVCRVQSQDNDNIALFKGKSMFSFTCAETTPLKGNAYNFDLPSKTYKYIADANDILPNEAHRYSMNEHQAARTIIYTKSTDEYADNEYHDCIRELVFNTDYVKRSVFAVLDNYECSVNNKELKIIRGEDFQFSASLNFTHISPEFTCTTEGIGSSSIDLSIDYYDNSTERSLKGKITANVVLKDIGLNGLKASCAFKYDHLENFKTEEIEHIENLPAPEGMPVAVIYKQPKFFFNDDKEKVVCKISVSYEYGPDNVKADLHPILEDRVLCTYSAIFSTKNRTIWRINGNEVSGTDGDILNITSITRPADISCEPCVEYFNGEINCTISGIFQLLDNSTPPVIKPPSGRNFPSNIAVFDDQTKPFRFYCHAYPSSPLVIHSSSFGPNGNLIADQNSIVPGQNHRYRMETDEYFTRIIEYNASSIAAYDDNIYHDCTVRHNETHRAVVVVLSNMECPETFVKGVEDTQFNLTYKIDFTHIEPLVKCNANTLGTVKYDKKIISNDPTKPMKTTLIATLIFYFPRKFGTYANCSFVYDRSENMYLSEAIHIQGFEPADAYFDSQLPLWAYEEDKQRASCHTKMEIQYGPSDIKITANPLDPNILSCDYDARADRFLYANWHVSII